MLLEKDTNLHDVQLGTKIPANHNYLRMGSHPLPTHPPSRPAGLQN